MAKKPLVSPRLIIDAAQKADRARLEELVAQGGDLNALYRKYRALHALIQTKPHADATEPSAAQRDCFAWMLEHGADPELLGGWPPARAILVAAFTGAREYVDVLLNASVVRDIWVNAALGEVAAVKRALKKDPAAALFRDAGNLTALQCACASKLWQRDEALKQRLREIVTLLLDAGADMRATTKSWDHDVDAVYFAASSHHLELYTLLLDRGADATDALTPGLWNTGKDFAAFGDAALAHGADVNRTMASGRPLINDLIRWGQFPPTLWLIEHGADPNRSQADGLLDSDGKPLDSAGWTPLHQAASRGSAKIAEALIAAGADITRRDSAGRTPLDIARAAPLKTLLRKARDIIRA